MPKERRGEYNYMSKNTLTFSEALEKRVQQYNKGEVVVSNDYHQVGVYSYENLDAERRYVVCRANCRGRDLAFIGDIIDLRIHDSKEAALDGYSIVLSDCDKAEEIIKELSQRRVKSG